MEKEGKENISYSIEREFLEKVDVSELISRIIRAHIKSEVIRCEDFF